MKTPVERKRRSQPQTAHEMFVEVSGIAAILRVGKQELHDIGAHLAEHLINLKDRRAKLAHALQAIDVQIKICDEALQKIAANEFER